MTIKHLFSDIDGTLFKLEGVSKKTIQKIQDFTRNGNKVYLATGRMDSDIKYLTNVLNIDCKYRISQNGSVIHNKQDEIIRAVTIPKEIAQEIAKYLFSLKDVRIEASTSTNRYAREKRPKHFQQEFTKILIVEPNLADMIGNSLDITIFVIMAEEEDFFIEVKEYINTNFGEHVQAIMTSLTNLEILNKDASKGRAISDIINNENIAKEDVYVVGDAENDISMFRHFDNSFAMKEAKAHVAIKANHGAYLVGDVIDYINNSQENYRKVHKTLVKFKNSLLAYIETNLPEEETKTASWNYKKLGAVGLKTNYNKALIDIKEELNIPVIASCYDIEGNINIHDNVNLLLQNNVDVISFNINKIMDNKEPDIDKLIDHIKLTNPAVLNMATIYNANQIDYISQFNFDIICTTFTENLNIEDVKTIREKMPNIYILCDGRISSAQMAIEYLSKGGDSIIIRSDTRNFKYIIQEFNNLVIDLQLKQYDNLFVGRN